MKRDRRNAASLLASSSLPFSTALSSGLALAARTFSLRWSVLSLLVLLSFVAYVLRTNMSVAGDAIMAEFGLTALQFGFVLGAFQWSYALCQFPGGLFGDRFGGRRALTWIALAWGAVTLLCGLGPRAEVTGPLVALGALVALRFALGVVQAPVFPVLADVVAFHVPGSAEQVEQECTRLLDLLS